MTGGGDSSDTAAHSAAAGAGAAAAGAAPGSFARRQHFSLTQKVSKTRNKDAYLSPISNCMLCAWLVQLRETEHTLTALA